MQAYDFIGFVFADRFGGEIRVEEIAGTVTTGQIGPDNREEVGIIAS